MQLKDLDGYEKITLQCHDNPDPDAIASAFGLYRYFGSKGRQVRIIYSGRFRITKSNLLLMISELDIPIQYLAASEEKLEGLLITVDCQYGQGNVTKFDADEVAVIDHHNGDPGLELQQIKPELGGCATLVWQMLEDAGYDIGSDRDLTTALYYGLMTDTGGFTDVYHPLDKDMRDVLPHNEAQIRLFSNSNISIEEMRITGEALAHYTCIDEHECGILQADECDPNILGIISDTALQVAEFKLVIAFGHVSGGYKLSVRSCVKEVMADEFIRHITAGVGSGGGHSYKAGGFISESALSEKHPGMSIREHLYSAVNDYFSSFEIVYASDYRPDMRRFLLYRKKELTLGYCDPLSFVEKGTPVKVRTLEGDMDLVADGSFVLMVGILGEVYPIKTGKFTASYIPLGDTFLPETEYMPKIYSGIDGRVYELKDHIRACKTTGTSMIRAARLDSNMKLFTEWDEEKYMSGSEGDFIACRADDEHDFYIVRGDIFDLTYELSEA
ncbi:MAG: DHH family phosphoesterase [Lachnospiraceae bacterium]|nr:DHH family phosphoesterase [Lachnospiraceae bacterium]